MLSVIPVHFHVIALSRVVQVVVHGDFWDLPVWTQEEGQDGVFHFGYSAGVQVRAKGSGRCDLLSGVVLVTVKQWGVVLMMANTVLL